MKNYWSIIAKIIRSTFKFSGRASLKDYWCYNLFILIVSSPLIIQMILFVGFDIYINRTLSDVLFIISIIPIIISLIPRISLTVRRYHDVGVSGTVIIWLFVSRLMWFILGGLKIYDEGDLLDNKYGQNPEKVSDCSQ